MTVINERHTRQDGRSASDKGFDTLPKQMPALNHVFEILAQGYTPNFLDVLGGISEMVAFYTDHDQKVVDSDVGFCKMSQNKCRFCS